MYILAVKEGYIQITISEETREVSLIEYETGINYNLNISGEEKTVKIIPTGSIAIDTFNEQWEKYLKAGGKVRKAPYNGNKNIPLTAPFPPFWPLSGDKPKDMSISKIAEGLLDKELFKGSFNFRPVSYIPFNGSLTPIFEVDELTNLYSYDCYRLQEAGIKVIQCEDCGRAFIPNTQAVRCKACRDAGMGNKKARKNFESKPGLKTLKNIIDRNRYIYKEKRYKRGKWTNGGISKGDVYFTRLNGVIGQYKNSSTTPEQLGEFADQLNDLDNRYYKLCKYFQSPAKNKLNSETMKEWLAEKTQFPQDEIEEMRQWIEKWENKK